MYTISHHPTAHELCIIKLLSNKIDMEQNMEMLPHRELTLQESAESLRSEIKTLGRRNLAMKRKAMSTPPTGDKELDVEVIANIVLAFRHLEDSAMRMGKVLQALNNGESIYDNSGVVTQK